MVKTDKKSLSPAEVAKRKEAAKAAIKAKLAAKLASLKPFRETAPEQIINPEGLLTVANVGEYGYDEGKHEQLERSDFADDKNWLTFRAAQLRARAAKMIAKAEQLEQEANSTGLVSDPAKRAQIKKVQKMAASLEAIKAQLAKEGIDVDSLFGAKPAAAE